MYTNYTAEERELVMKTSLTDLARFLGYTPVKKGRFYSLREMDSIMILNDATWCRWSKIHAGEIKGKGGTQIDFMIEFGGCSSVPEAIHKILELNHIHVFKEITQPIKSTANVQMQLPEKAEGYRYLYAYLCKTRKLSYEVVSYFVRDLKILYESKEHHNLVFLGRDKYGEIKYAMQRGTSDIYGRIFKGDVKGNDKSYGVNIVNSQSDVLKVFESSIDCMSYIDLTGDVQSNKLVLGMLHNKPLQTFLQEYSHIKEIWFCFDNDEAARKAVLGTVKEQYVDGVKKMIYHPGLMELYQQQGYRVVDAPAEQGKGKDYNENLKYYREYEADKIVGMLPKKRYMKQL